MIYNLKIIFFIFLCLITLSSKYQENNHKIEFTPLLDYSEKIQPSLIKRLDSIFSTKTRVEMNYYEKINAYRNYLLKSNKNQFTYNSTRLKLDKK